MRTFIAFFLVIVFTSCQTSDKPKYTKTTKDLSVEKTLKTKEHLGKKLMEANCYVCHSPKATHTSRIAPPMLAVKKHYISKNTSKKEFINAMQNWIKNPIIENSKMKGAVKRFGLMPKTPFPEKTIQLIADYLFDNEIEKPNHFKKHKTVLKTNEEKGLQIALATKSVLGKNLMTKIQKEGTISALSFCNEKAYSLTDSMSILQKATIKRVSDKPRNLKNSANKKEKEYIEFFKKEIKNNKEPKPIIVEMGEKTDFFYPIKTNGMCLQCHGTPTKDIKNKTLSLLKKLYPKDKAQGYKVNQVRGIWSISFKK